MKYMMSLEVIKMIEINNASKYIEGKVIFENLSLSIQKGSIFGLVGTNGAGKTSLIKSIMGIWNIDKGSIYVNGLDTSKDCRFRSSVGYVSDDITIPGSYTVENAIKFYKYGFSSFDIEYFNMINEIYKIPLNSKIRELSKGSGIKLSIMLNLSIKPEILIMDEPLSCLDPIVRKETVKLLFSDTAQRGTTVFLSSHNLADIEKFCDTFGVLDGGNLRYTNQIDEIKKKVRKLQLVFPNGVPEVFSQQMPILENVSNINVSGRVVQFLTENYSDELEEKFKNMGASLVETIDIGLDEIFFHIMEGHKNDKTV